MSARRIAMLGAVAVVALVAALWSTQSRRPVQQETLQAPLVPGLEQGLNDVSEVRIRGAEGKLLATLVRGEDGWTLREKGDYAVDVARVREYLLKLAQARRVEAKTSNPALYERLGVEEIEAGDAAGVQIEIDGLAQPVKLIIGHNVQRGTGTYVREAGVATSWQASADLALERTPANWLQRDLVDIAAGRVAKVSVKPAQGEAVEIVRSGGGAGGDFALARLPRGREAASEFVADATAGLLSGLRFDDVFPASEIEVPEEGVRVSEFTTEDGLVIGVRSWQVGDKTYAQLAARLDETIAAAHVEQAQARAIREHEALVAAASAPAPAAGVTEGADGTATAPAPAPAAPTPTPPAAPLAVTDAVQDREQRLAALRDEAAALTARFEPWTFVLPSFKAGNLNKPLEDYLKPRT